MEVLMRFSATLIAIPVLLLCGAIQISRPAPARAQWPPEGLLVASRGDSVKVVSDGAGGVIVAWINFTRLYVQRVSDTGVQQWTPGGVLVGGDGFAGPHDVISDGAGGAIVAWERYPAGIGGPPGDIYAQRVSSTGALLWGADGVAVCSDIYAQTQPVLTTDGAGGAIIAWEDQRAGTADVYARRVLGNGTATWTPDGVPVCALQGDQRAPAILTDGAGGAVLGWEDLRAGPFQGHIYAQRVSSAGLLLWAGQGVSISPGSSDQDSVQIVSDRAGGWLLGWVDNAWIWAQRLDGNGTTMWMAGGVRVGGQNYDGRYGMTCDDNGGVVTAWTGGDLSTLGQIWAQRALVSNGALQWGALGRAVAGSGDWPAITSDGTGGTILAWLQLWPQSMILGQRLDITGAKIWPTATGEVVDACGGTVWPRIAADGDHGAFVGFGTYDDDGVRVQRMLWSGLDGSFLATILRVSDLPADQGGWVRLDLQAAVADSARHAPGVTGYGVWRQVSSGLASMEASVVTPARVTPSLEDVQHGNVRLSVQESQAAGFPPGSWESGGYVPALQDSRYLVAAPTRNDSTSQGQADETYLVTIHTATPWLYAVSPSATGHSVDNLAPVLLPWFSGEYIAGNAVLHWPVSPEGDFKEYRLYAGSTPDFTPDPGHLIVTKPDTGYTHAAGERLYYKLSAVDRHGNEGPHALTIPTATAGVGPGAVPERLALYLPLPHPLRGRSTVRFDLPASTEVALRVYDVAGRAVRVLIESREMPAGRHEWAWDGMADGGRPVRPDVYFVRLETRLGTLTRKVVVVE
jgi:hypothetical protein